MAPIFCPLSNFSGCLFPKCRCSSGLPPGALSHSMALTAVSADRSHSSVPSRSSHGRQNRTPSCLLGSSIWMSHSTSGSLCLKQHRLPPAPRTSCFLAFPTSRTAQSSCLTQKLGVTLTSYSSSFAPPTPTPASVTHTSHHSSSSDAPASILLLLVFSAAGP